MGIQINGSTDRITAIDGTIDFVSNIGNIGLITASNYVLQDAITIGAGSTIIKTVNGELGIGTATPSEKLTVHTASGNTKQVLSSHAGFSELDFVTASTLRADVFANASEFTFTTRTAIPIVFRTNGTNERLRITSAGLVGVGQATPTHMLHVDSSNASDTTATAFFKGRIIRFDGAASAHSPRLNFSLDGTDKAQILLHRTNIGLDIATLAAEPIKFEINSVEKLRIASTGRVAIGNATNNASPTALLQVKADDGEAADLYVGQFDNLEATAGQSYGVAIRAGSNSTDHGFRVKNRANDTTQFLVRGDGSIRVGNNSSFSAHVAASNLVVGTTSGSNGMTILTGSATGNIFFNDGSGNDGVVQYVHSSSPNYMRIASSGHIRFDVPDGISISDDNIAPTAGDLASGASFGIPKLHIRGDNSQSGAYELLGRFQSGTDADNSGATIVLNHSNDRGLAIQGGRSGSNRSHGALMSVDNIGRLSDCIKFVGGNGQGVNRLSFYTGESTTTSEALRINSSRQVRIGGSLTSSFQCDLDVVKQNSTLTDVMLVKGNVGNGFIRFQDNDNSCNFTLGADDGSGLGAGAFILYDRSTSAYRWSVDSSGNMRVWDGNVKLASGHGIDFSATGAPTGSGSSGTAELLDDYEEGSWTPLLKRYNGGTESSFYNQNTQQGHYTKVGNSVFIRGRIHWSGGSTGSGSTILTNLPFAAENTGSNETPITIGYRSGWNYPRLCAYLRVATGNFRIQYVDASNYNSYDVSPGAVNSSGTFYFSAQYQTTA